VYSSTLRPATCDVDDPAGPLASPRPFDDPGGDPIGVLHSALPVAHPFGSGAAGESGVSRGDVDDGGQDAREDAAAEVGIVEQQVVIGMCGDGEDRGRHRSDHCSVSTTGTSSARADSRPIVLRAHGDRKGTECDPVH
jgi:hypothetical protein